MAEVVEGGLPDIHRPGRPEKYPWDDWLNGQVWRLVSGEDFTQKPETFRKYVSRVARDRGLKVKTRVAISELAWSTGESGELVPRQEDVVYMKVTNRAAAPAPEEKAPDPDLEADVPGPVVPAKKAGAAHPGGIDPAEGDALVIPFPAPEATQFPVPEGLSVVRQEVLEAEIEGLADPVEPEPEVAGDPLADPMDGPEVDGYVSLDHLVDQELTDPDLGGDYLERVTQERTLSPEDEDLVNSMLEPDVEPITIVADDTASIVIEDEADESEEEEGDWSFIDESSPDAPPNPYPADLKEGE